MKYFGSDLRKSIFSGYALFLLNNVVALFLTPYMLDYVTKEEYGLYIICVDFLAWVSFLEFGTSKVIESKAGHLLATNSQEEINVIFNSSFFFQIIIGILIVPLFYYSVKLGLGESEFANRNTIILLFSFSAGLSVFKTLFSSLIIASRKVHLDNSIQFFINIINYSLILLLTPFIGVIGLAAISLFISILILLRSNHRLRRLFPFVVISRESFNLKELESLFSQGVFFSLGSIATILVSRIDNFVIGKYIGLETVASYYVSIKLFMLVQKLIQILYNNYRPYISFLYGKKDFDGIGLFCNTSSWFIYGFSMVLIALTMIFNVFFVTVWVGKEFLLGQRFIMLFGTFILFDLFTLPSRSVLISSLFKIKIHSFSRFLEGGSRILILLLFFETMCIISIPLSSVISTFIFGNIFFHIQLKSYFSSTVVVVKSIFLMIPVLIITILLSLLFIDLEFIFPFLLLIMGCLVLIRSYFHEKSNLITLKNVLKIS